MKPTTDQTLCKDGSPAVTYDGVAITAGGEYWAIPELEPGDFEGLPTGIPNKARKVSGQEIVDSCDPDNYASTREKANVAALEIYTEWVQRRIESARQDVQLFERYYEKAYYRLAAYRAENNS